MLIGSLTSWHGWAWQGWPALVSIGTVLLAGATVWLAFYTRKAVEETKSEIKLATKELGVLEAQTQAIQDQAAAVSEQAEATKRQAELSAAALEASIRPVLVGVPLDTSDHPETEKLIYTPGPDAGSVQRSHVDYQTDKDRAYCSVPLRNVGAGIAFVQRVVLLIDDAPYGGRISNPVIPPGEGARVRFSLPLVDQEGRRTAANAITGVGGRGFVQFTVFVVYTGTSRDLVTASEITVAEIPDRGYLVMSNEIYDGDTGPRTLLASSANVG